jgi:hypothetical protein
VFSLQKVNDNINTKKEAGQLLGTIVVKRFGYKQTHDKLGVFLWLVRELQEKIKIWYTEAN